ncbi:hypothetical protein D3C87_1360080 [compost metagenome]
MAMAIMHAMTDRAMITVSTTAMSRCFNQVRVSMISDDLLKAIMRLCTPLVAKNSDNKKPKDNKPRFCLCTISSSVALKAL